MAEADFEGANSYAQGRLARELPAHLIYHSLAHTRDEVVPVADLLAVQLQLPPHERLLLRTAAYFHDIGFVEQSAGHELVGIRIAGEVLPGFGFGAADIAAIGEMILATRLPQRASSLPAAILADADLDVLGRGDFWSRNAQLRAEMAAGGQQFADADWYAGQLRFLSSHSYFTAPARAHREDAKQQHIRELAARLHGSG